jgi:hypothetical protein
VAGRRGRAEGRNVLREVAVAEVQERLAELLPRWAPPASAADLARVQLAVLDEVDPDLRSPAGRRCYARLGPYFGLVGPPPRTRDTEPEVWITHLEATARCGWQAFLRKRLGLEEPPDALAALPVPDPRLLGSVVHAVLDRIVRDALEDGIETLEQALARGPRLVPWPGEERLAAIVVQETERVARAAGIHHPGFARAVARLVRGEIEAARRADWSSDPIAVLGAELMGSFRLVDAAGRERRIGFRADRVDRIGATIRVTDYKTGKPFGAGKDDTRRRSLLAEIGKGTALQGPLYHAAALQLAGVREAEGRYLFLKDGLPADAREYAVTGGDADLVTSFVASTRQILAALDHGALAPRLSEGPGANRWCTWCEVAAACLHGESAHRRRLLEWNARARAEPPSDEVSRAVLGLLDLGRERSDPTEEET